MGFFRGLRKFLYSLASLAVLIIVICIATNPTPLAPPPSEEDCVTIRVSDNGWHTNLYLTADTFPEDHPFRRDYPWAGWFVVGWGDESFYRDGPTVARGIDAIIPPSPTVIHVIALSRPPEFAFLDRNVEFALSREGLGQLVTEINASLQYDAEGEPIIVSEGQYPGSSRFYRSRHSYHAFHTCNQWTAGVLRKAGLPINASASLMSGSLLWQLDRLNTTCTSPVISDTDDQ